MSKEKSTMTQAWHELERVYAEKATRRYGLESISQLDHALQGAALAEADGESDALIVATLLHDIGHMVHKLGEKPAERGIDDLHEALGAKQLAKLFGPEVSEPVRLHVAAKRYLCAVEADYFAKLSKDSVLSLSLQGGPMTPEEVEAFRRQPHWQDAVKLRRWDEAAKVTGLSVPPFAAYRDRVLALLAEERRTA
jgi:phosphonate degradation associated HDIG domain protein